MFKLVSGFGHRDELITHGLFAIMVSVWNQLSAMQYSKCVFDMYVYLQIMVKFG